MRGKQIIVIEFPALVVFDAVKMTLFDVVVDVAGRIIFVGELLSATADPATFLKRIVTPTNEADVVGKDAVLVIVIFIG